MKKLSKLGLSLICLATLTGCNLDEWLDSFMGGLSFNFGVTTYTEPIINLDDSGNSSSMTLDEWQSYADTYYSVETVSSKYESVTVAITNSCSSEVCYSEGSSNETYTYDSGTSSFNDCVMTSSDVSSVISSVNFYLQYSGFSYSLTNSSGAISFTMTATLDTMKDMYPNNSEFQSYSAHSAILQMKFGVNGEYLYCNEVESATVEGYSGTYTKSISYSWNSATQSA